MLSLAEFWVLIRARLVDDWHRAWRWSSVRLSALGVLGFGTFASFPSLAVQCWNALPASVRDRLPDHVAYIVAAMTCLTILLGRVTSLKGKIDGGS